MKVIIILLSLILVSNQIMASPDDDLGEEQDTINTDDKKTDSKPAGNQPDPAATTPKGLTTTSKELDISTESSGGNPKAQSAPNSRVDRMAPMVAVFGTVLVNIGLNLQKSML